LRSRAPLSGEAERLTPSTGRPKRGAGAVPAIVTLLMAGLLLRLFLAYVALPGSGFRTDLGSFTAWAIDLAQHGPGPFYAQAGFADYPPGYLYVLWLVGIVGQAWAGLTGADAGQVIGGLIKVPPILADLGVAYLLYRIVRSWRAGRSDAHLLALAAAALYLFNPVSWYDSAVWGQVDAIGALVLLGALLLLIDGQPELATGLGALAGLVKPQYGVVLAPILAVILLRRHVFAIGSGPRPSWGPTRLRRWLDEEQGPLRLVTSAVVGLAVLIVLSAPFSLDLIGLAKHLASAAGGYPFLTVNANNPWALLGTAGNAPYASGGGWSPDVAGTNAYGSTFTAAQVAILGLPPVIIGTALLIAGFLIGAVQLGLRDDRRSILLAAAYLSLAFFILPTRVHERYLFPVFALLPLLAIRDRGFTIATLVLAAGSFINLHGVLTTPFYATPNLAGLPLGATFRTYDWILLSVILQTAVFGYALWRMRPASDLLVQPLRARLGFGPRSADRDRFDDPDPLGPAPTPDVPMPDRRTVGPEVSIDHQGSPVVPGSSAALPAAMSGTTGPPAGAGADRPSAASPGPSAAVSGGSFSAVGLIGDGGLAAASAGRSDGFLDRVAGWWSRQLRRRSLRADRSDQLVREPTGRIDRLDLVIVALLLVGGLMLRTFGLQEPYGMHFDEVYHARTATEFLQFWRYGEVHNIYEWTHPHLAKYSIAVGLILFGDDQVTGTASLGIPVTDALVEPRWSPTDQPSLRDGDRLYVATGTSVAVYDLKTRARITAFDLSGSGGAQQLALDQTTHTLFIIGRSGEVSSLATSTLDALRSGGSGTSVPAPTHLGSAGGPPVAATVSADSRDLVVALAGGRLASLDVASGAVVGTASDPGASALLSLSDSTVMVNPSQVTSPSAVASGLTSILGGDAASLAARLQAGGSPFDVAAPFDSGRIQQVQTAIGQGQLPGVSIGQGAIVAVADAHGLTVWDASSLSETHTFAMPQGATGLALDPNLDQPTLYVAGGNRLERFTVPAGGPFIDTGGQDMPGQVRDVRWDPASNLIHVLGRTPNGTSDTIYVVEPHGNAVFADARLPFSAVTWDLDVNQPYPTQDRQQAVALSATGQLATVDVGSHAFAWRFVGVLLGALTVVLIFILARLLFRRRGVALIAAFLVLADGMFFANTRIAMNDVYVNFFIVAAYTLFAALSLGHWRGRSATLVGLPLLGILIGLACASKWVGFYALGGLVLLTFLRSALGRWLALGGMIGLTGLMGWLAIESPNSQAPFGNTTFLAVMVLLTLVIAAAMIWRPIRWSPEEVRFAVRAPAALGGLVILVGLLLASIRVAAVGAALVGLGVAVWLVLRLAARQGFGPLARAPDPHDPVALLEPAGDPPSEGWLRPGASRGGPFVWAFLCLTLLPLAVYVISYTPWVALGNQFWGGFPPGNHGQTLWDLTIQMYNYHNDLRATHPATSPWWAWPFDLKPVWFYQEGFANDTVGIIYDAGNLVAFWLSIPAAIWAAWAGWRRRSLPMLLVLVALLCQWIPWASIDRATFQYHYFTVLPFVYLALAYFLHELWRGPSIRTFTVARLAAAAAILGVPLLWVGKAPLCWLADVARVDPTSQACGSVSEPFVLTQQVAIAAVVLLVGLVAVAWQVRLMRQAARELQDEGRGSDAGRLFPPGTIWLLLTVLFTLIALALAVVRFGDVPVISAPLGDLGPYAFAVLVGAPLAFVAWLVTRIRDPRRFAVGLLGAIGLWFVVFYPDISGLPIPSGLRNLYSVLPLPTYNYDFQFAVNTSPAPTVTPPLLGLPAASLTLVTAVLVAAVMYAAWSWRLARAVGSAQPEGDTVVP
jgi:Gpi18-like mannosyltransferase